MMPFPSYKSRILLVTAVLGAFDRCNAILRLPLQHQILHRDKHAISTRDADTSLFSANQIPLQDASGTNAQEIPHQPLGDVATVLVGFNISIGSPPQSVPVALSIETPFMMVQSASCETSPCEMHNGFNSTSSSSFNQTTEEFREEFGLVRWSGHVATETISIANLTLPEARFLHADQINYIAFIAFYFEYDGVLGLTPQSEAWNALTTGGHLEQKMVSIKFPTGPIDFQHPEARSSGELTLGGVHPDYTDGPFIDLPVIDAAGDFWATNVSAFAIESGETKEEPELPNPTKAIFSTANPFVILPEAWVRALAEPIREEILGFVMGQPAFPCELRDSMIKISMVLGAGDEQHNITLSAYEYSIEVESQEADQKVCVFVASMGWYSDTIAFGWPFLRMFVTVLDGEAGRIRLIPKGPDA